MMKTYHISPFLGMACLMLMILPGCQTTSSTGKNAALKPEMTIDAAIEKTVKQAEALPETEKKLELLEKIYNMNPQDEYAAVHYARALREDNQIGKAQLVLSPLAAKDDAGGEPMTEMAMIYLGLGRYSDAEKMAMRAIEKDSENGRAYLALGTAQDAQEKHEVAEKSFRTGLDKWNGDPAPILNNLALNLASQGQVNDAISVLEKARSLSPRRMEIERNYRIISTLQEETGPRFPKPTHKPSYNGPLLDTVKDQG